MAYPDPLMRTMRVLANGMSVGTTSEGVLGKVVSVLSLEELADLDASGALKGSIVLYDWRSYSEYGLSGPFRGRALGSGKHGANQYLFGL